MKKYTFRKAKMSDLEFIFSLIKATMKEHITKIYGNWDDEFQRNYCKKSFDPKKHKVIVVDGEDIGCISVTQDDINIQIERLLISPAFQSLGIGTEILKELKKEAGKNSKTLSLTVLHSNKRAKMLYERMGFNVTKKTEEDYHMTCQ